MTQHTDPLLQIFAFFKELSGTNRNMRNYPALAIILEGLNKTAQPQKSR